MVSEIQNFKNFNIIKMNNKYIWNMVFMHLKSWIYYDYNV